MQIGPLQAARNAAQYASRLVRLHGREAALKIVKAHIEATKGIENQWWHDVSLAVLKIK